MENLASLVNDNGECIVDFFSIGRKGFGSVSFEGPVNLTNLNLDEIVHFYGNEILMYSDESDKPPVGEGLNRPAEVTLHGVWPIDRTTHRKIKSPSRLSEMGYMYTLEDLSYKQGVDFKEYRPETGSWVFAVNYF